jgi:F-type H+-transporting ATPase subunit b
MAAALAVGTSPAARAQPPAAPQAPKAPPVPKPGEGGLPAWHPPIDPPSPAPKGMPAGRGSAREQQERIRKLVEEHQRQRGKSPAPARRYARDEHGHCIGHGIKDRPPELNLVHGWVGVRNDKAVAPPPQRGTWAWWKWRLTPYPWRYQNHADHCDPRNQPVPLAANVLNAAVLLFVLYRFGRKPLAEALRKRRETIMSEIDRAREIRSKARERLAFYEGELEHLDDRLAALRATYAEEGEMEKERLLTEMEQRDRRMMDDVAFRIAQEAKATRDELGRRALEDAMRAAEALLEKSVRPEDHERLAEEYLERLPAALRREGLSAGARGGASLGGQP